MKPNYNLTTSYKYNNHEEEYVLCYRSRPFAMLSSDFLPTPASSYIDHHLVLELGMKMTEIGCKKLSFAGKKMRMLGKVSFTAQCVQDGHILGNIHVKASVVEDLKYHFDTHAIAGTKMTTLLNGERDNASSSSNCSTPSRAKPSPSPPPTPPQARPSAPLQGHARPPAKPDHRHQPLLAQAHHRHHHQGFPSVLAIHHHLMQPRGLLSINLFSYQTSSC